jgi:uncharacterized membrane protein YqjE
MERVFREETGEPSTAALLARLARDSAELLVGEVQLARLELEEKLRRVTTGATTLGLAALLLLVGLQIAGGGIVFLLAQAMPMWCAALVVGTVFGSLGSVAALRGLRVLDRQTPVEVAPTSRRKGLHG